MRASQVELKLEQGAVSAAKAKLDQDAALRAAALRAEQDRALDLLQREKANALALASSAEGKLRKAEAAASEVGRMETEMRRRLEMAEEQARSAACTHTCIHICMCMCPHTGSQLHTRWMGHMDAGLRKRAALLERYAASSLLHVQRRMSGIYDHHGVLASISHAGWLAACMHACMHARTGLRPPACCRS